MTSLLDWPTRMFPHGIGISAGSFLCVPLFIHYIVSYSKDISLVNLNWFSVIMSGCVRISQLFYAEIRLMLRTGRWKRSRSHFTGRRIFSTMRFLQRATTTLRSLSCILPGSLLGNWKIVKKSLISLCYLSCFIVLHYVILCYLWLIIHYMLQGRKPPLCWVTCSCSTRSANWHGCTTTVSDNIVYIYWFVILVIIALSLQYLPYPCFCC